LLLELGADLADEKGDRLAPIALLLQTYSRYPQGMHRCLELAAERGIELPDTPVMAVHRGRIDLLEAHSRRDPGMIGQTFPIEEIYPRELGCGPDYSFGLHGTPLAGTTLLHICVEFDEVEIARWLIEHGADVNARAEMDADGLGACLARSGGSGCPAVITSFVHRFDGPAAITANLPLFVIPGLVGVVVRHGDQLIVTYIPAGRPVLDAAAHRGRAIPRHRRRGARHGRLAAPSAYHLTPAG